MKNNPECRCEKTACNCAAERAACDCGESCPCQPSCGCDDCACESAR